MAEINVQSLNDSAIRMKPDLLKLPAMYLDTEMRQAGIMTLSGIQYIDRQHNYIRKGGVIAPYQKEMTETTDELGHVEENDLQMHLAAAYFYDHIQDYRKTNVGNMSMLGTNKTYKNPAHALILYSSMLTVSEDLYDALFFAERDAAGKTKYDIFDGYYTIIDKARQSGRLNPAFRNMVRTGAIAAPVDENDFQAYEQAVAFIRGAHPVLTRGKCLLDVTPGTAQKISDAFYNKYKRSLAFNELDGSFKFPEFPNVKVNPCPMMGEGDLMILTRDQNLHFGVDSESDDEKIDIVKTERNPNILRYWIQANYGTRVGNMHAKVFCVNDGTLSAIAFSGDENPEKYTISVSVAGSAGGTAVVNEAKEKYALGEYAWIKATADSGKKFTQWSDGNKEAERKILMKKNLTLTATFVNA